MNKPRIRIVYFILIVLVITGAVLEVSLGSTVIAPAKVIRILTDADADRQVYTILTQIRIPRMIMAAVLGGALAVSGYLLQTFFGNPIAGPYVLGISSGAKLTVSAVMIFMVSRTGRSTGAMMVLAALAGSLIVTAFIVLISGKVRHMASLLAAGVMVGYICSALTDFLVTFADDAQIVNLHGWSQGTFSGMDMGGVRVAMLIVGAAMAVTIMLAKPIGAFTLGEAYAQSMGVNVRVYRIVLILLSSVLSACVTAFAGPVSFVGIAVPFLMRESLGTARPPVLIPAVFLGGAGFCLYSDLAARMMFAPIELNISTVTSLLGAPVVIFMLLRRKGIGR